MTMFSFSDKSNTTAIQKLASGLSNLGFGGAGAGAGAVGGGDGVVGAAALFGAFGGGAGLGAGGARGHIDSTPSELRNRDIDEKHVFPLLATPIAQCVP